MHLKLLEQFLAHGKHSINTSSRRRPSIEELAQLMPYAHLWINLWGKREWSNLTGQIWVTFPLLCTGRLISKSHSIIEKAYVGADNTMFTTGPTPGPILTRTGEKQPQPYPSVWFGMNLDSRYDLTFRGWVLCSSDLEALSPRTYHLRTGLL